MITSMTAVALTAAFLTAHEYHVLEQSIVAAEPTVVVVAVEEATPAYPAAVISEMKSLRTEPVQWVAIEPNVFVKR